MSFTIEVKEEIIAHTFSPTQKQALLAGFIKQNGELILAANQERLRLTTISNRVARNLISFIKEIFDGEIMISIIQGKTLKRVKIFQLNLIGEIAPFLQLLKIVPFTPEQWPVTDLAFWRAYMAGLFIASGSINSPQAKHYHLEITFKTPEEADFFVEKIQHFNFPFRLLKRSNYRWIAYLKSATKISDFLKFLDAHQAVWDFENNRIARDIANNINRIQNIDISNQTKTLQVGQRQVQEIKELKNYRYSSKLTPKISSLMALRLAFPEATYRELAQKMSKKGYNITKAGVSNLLRQIHQMAQTMNVEKAKEPKFND